MPRFVALLRGVNVGKGKRVPMAALRQLLAALAKTLHVDVPVIVKSSSDIASIQKENTLASKAGRFATTRNWATVAKISALLHKGIAGKPSR